MRNKAFDTKTLAKGAILTAIVIVLQYLGQFIRFGPFSVSLVLIPIVIGAAMCGKGISSWLGLIFGIVVILTGDAAAFLAVNPFGTFVTVIAKGVLAGFVAALVYQAIVKHNRFVAVLAAAIVCPIVNTGIFLIASRVFFFDLIKEWANGMGMDAIKYMFVGLVGLNFVAELAVNVILSPAVVKVIDILQGRLAKR